MLTALLAALAAAPLITIMPAPDGDTLLATLALEAEHDVFVFAPNDSPQRADAWSVPHGWTFDGRTVARVDGAAFDTVTFRIEPDERFHDRKYVVTSRVGTGWALYLSAFGGADASARVTFEGFGENAVLRLHGHEGGLGAPATADTDDRRVAYVGPVANVEVGDVTLIAGPELPAWVRDALAEDARRVARVLEDRLGAAALHPPTILASYDPRREGFSFKGGALDGATMRLVIASDLTERSDAVARRLAGFTAHETVHVWLNEVWDTTENASQPWLHEGAAEYLSDRLTLKGEAFEADAVRHVEDCLAGLGARPLDGSDGRIYGTVPYDCGVTMQLAAEVASLRRDGGDALTLWRRVVDGTPDGQYASADFLAAATAAGGDAFADVASALLTERGEAKVPALMQAFAGLGLVLSRAEPGPEDAARLNGAAMLALQKAHCEGRYSFYTEADGYRFALPTPCEGMPHDAHVVGVQGLSFEEDGLAAYEAMRAACEEGAALSFSVIGGDDPAPFACRAALPAAVGGLRVTGLPALPDLGHPN